MTMSIGIIVINIAEQPARLQQRPRRPFISLPAASAIEMIRSAVARAFFRGAVPRLRRIPRMPVTT
jgi:hypothetical protein